MSIETAMANAAQVLTKLQQEYPNTMSAICDDIDLSDAEFTETVATLDDDID